MDDLNKAFNHLFGFKVPIDDYDEFEKKVEEARELKEHLNKVEVLKDIPQIITPVKMTNYDRIKSMSVEEMAEYLSDHWSCVDCAFEKDCDDNYISCHKNIKQWLEQEAER